MSDIQLHGNIYPKFVTQSHRIQGKKMPAEKKKTSRLEAYHF